MARGSRSGGGGRSSFSSGGGRGSRSAPSRSSFSSSRSSFSFGGGHSHHSHHHHRPRVHIHVGSRYHYGYGGSSNGGGIGVVYAVLIIFAIIFSFAGISSVGEINYHKESVEIAKDEYNFYQDMIEYANDHEDEGYIVYGTVVNKYLDDSVSKYYVVYTVPGMLEEFETFAVYSLSDVSQYRQGSPIRLALGGNVINEDTESIDTDFANVELEEFSLYILANEHVKSATIRTVICLGIPAAFVGVMLVLIIRSHKKRSNSSDSTPEVETSSEESRCKYCGSTYEAGKRKCSNCGASLKK